MRILTIGALALAPAWSLAKPDPVEDLFDEGKYAEAKPIIEKQLEASPANPYLLYNLALTHYAAGNYEEAIVLWEKVRLSPDPDLVTKAMAQIGNASYRISEEIKEAGRQEDATIQLRRAQHSLQAAVERDDDYDVAAQNYEFVSAKLVEHLVQQGNSKIEKADTKWVKGERDLVLFRSALTDYEEALSIEPDDEEIQKLVEDTRQRMTDYLAASGERNLEEAEKKLETVKEPSPDDRLMSEEARELNHAENHIMEAVANFEDASSISPDDAKTAQVAEQAREQASKLMAEIADKWRQNTEAMEEKISQMEQRRDDINKQLKSEKGEEQRSDLNKESKELAREIGRFQYHVQDQQKRALEDYEQALAYDPDNQKAFAAKWELEKKMSQQFEDKADASLNFAQSSLQNIENRKPRLEQMREQLPTADAKRQSQLEKEIEKYESYQAASAQTAADQLLSAKTDLEKAVELDAANESALKKLEETSARIADALEQAADYQMASAEQLEAAGKEDQSIARMEMAIKNFDSAMALSDTEQQQDALAQKLEAAQQELLSQRNERSLELAAAQQQMQADQQPQLQQPAQPDSDNKETVAMEYQEMVQFAEDASGSEEFGNFDTKAMKRVVKDW
ncbi:tetratricopeptide repeat protein [Cerasicoccus frondis]|uniref:tetratricopeptide repeat protein n=1 Tax=Cerasicoccus frondis TaxID=490090 RepID=UPI002852D163|nr:tetratricopeptide repeat protein [Cerasicoccus frondis]